MAKRLESARDLAEGNSSNGGDPGQLSGIASAAAPFVVGSIAGTQGFGLAIAITGGPFLMVAIMWIGVPNTANRELMA